MEVTKIFTFDAAHNLPNYVGPCKNMHGHTYKLEITVRGDIDFKTGMVVDFSNLNRVVRDEVITVLDHKLLNEVEYNPTAEHLCLWILDRLKHNFQKNKYVVSKIRLWETPTSYATWRIEDE